MVLQLTQLLVHGVLARLQRLRLGVLRRAGGPLHALHFGRDLLLLVGQRFGLTQGVLHVALSASALVLLQTLLRLLDLVERGGGLRAGVA